jgi:hypothetical protein
MEQILITVDSKDTSAAIKNYVSQFEDASVEEQFPATDEYYLHNYGTTKAVFEERLNKGLAQSILGLTKSWDEVKKGLFEKINSNAKN